MKKYAFGPERANALVVNLPNDKLIVTNPPCNVNENELKLLAQHGQMTALLANNSTHHLNLGPARKIFPDATNYATARATTRIHSKNNDTDQLTSIETLQPLLGDKVAIFAVDEDKIDDVLVRMRTEKRTLLYANDFITNIETLPSNLIFKLMFKLTDSGPKLKMFEIFFKFFVKDRKTARNFLVKKIETNPPTILVPAHDQVVAQNNLAQTLVSILQTTF